ncbi:MAG: NUDIX hydrolase [Candidatus Korarchaeota archaeon]|nr:NUDIX hydrolase [Thermoproteota archaeon]MCR8455595.1 NUDIX hydrolase [Thermoproteota archaeon]MCR8463179.1 NUDIX hydrolase [Thermoproteota archaeon]MCR8470576.1 NUDIX hydrolase [Thermoproteota archaeon]MCR8472505.1 NUDIX hydrolase [Thermoproteota archaeon]
MHNFIETLGEELVWEGRKIRLKKLKLKIRGSETFHEIVDFGESVSILPFKDDKTVILEKQFRGPIRGWLLEIPAGRIRRGEEIKEAANRELREETGYVAGQFDYLGSFILTPGYSNEKIHLLVARELKYVGRELEEHEAIEVVEMPYRELLNMILCGKISDAKTVLAVLIYEMRKILVCEG